MNQTRTSRLLTLTALAVLGAVFSSSVIWAQTTPPADTYKVNYFSNANTAGVPDETVQITNPGSTGGSVCALIYVTNPSQEVLECCACSITENGLLTLSVNGNLTANSLTPEAITAGTIHVISSSTCNAAKPTPVSGGVRAWGTHIQMPAGATAPTITETDFLDATLSSAEESKLGTLCGSFISNGSGFGICNCGLGG
ncbi:MAG: hypothetical protein ABSH24_31765 [Bryobacteraceae bacterium]